MRIAIVAPSRIVAPPEHSIKEEHKEPVEAARLAGCRIVYIPPTFDECGSADAALAHVGEQVEVTPAVWVGYIPTPERYSALYEAALARGMQLLNDPDQFRLAMEFDRFYPLLGDLTPESAVVWHADETSRVAAHLDYPIFVKGAVQSRKREGWRACVAYNDEELTAIVAAVLSQEHRARGRAILRKLVRLRHVRTSEEGFPLGREYRVFLYAGRVVAHGYYWEGDDPLRVLDPAETTTMLRMALAAAQRLAVPYLVVDVGQLEDGAWVVIEVGDAQFAGHNDISPFALWHGLLAALSTP
jgi:hypothetical protein